VHDVGNYPDAKQLLARRKSAQLETVDKFEIFYAFEFEDQIAESNTTFIHKK